jgi:hypothetical protein
VPLLAENIPHSSHVGSARAVTMFIAVSCPCRKRLEDTPQSLIRNNKYCRSCRTRSVRVIKCELVEYPILFLASNVLNPSDQIIRHKSLRAKNPTSRTISNFEHATEDDIETMNLQYAWDMISSNHSFTHA